MESQTFEKFQFWFKFSLDLILRKYPPFVSNGNLSYRKIILSNIIKGHNRKEECTSLYELQHMQYNNKK